MILATTKRMSAKDCQPRNAGGLHIVGCDYSAAFIAGKWQVLVIYAQELDGKRVHPSGGMLYIFDASGKFVEIVPGM